MKQAMKNSTTKGFAVLYKEKILPALSLNKGQRSNNSAAVKIVSEEARNKFIDSWKNTTVDIEADNTRRGKIEAVVKPLIGTNKALAVIDIQEVKDILVSKEPLVVEKQKLEDNPSILSDLLRKRLNEINLSTTSKAQ